MFCRINLPEFFLVTALRHAKILCGGGEVKTAPATEPLNIPLPTNPEISTQTSYVNKVIN